MHRLRAKIVGGRQDILLWLISLRLLRAGMILSIIKIPASRMMPGTLKFSINILTMTEQIKEC